MHYVSFLRFRPLRACSPNRRPLPARIAWPLPFRLKHFPSLLRTAPALLLTCRSGFECFFCFLFYGRPASAWTSPHPRFVYFNHYFSFLFPLLYLLFFANVR